MIRRSALLVLLTALGCVDAAGESEATGASDGATTGSATTTTTTGETTLDTTLDTGETTTGEGHPTVPCDQCFPLEALPAVDRAAAEALLLRALDREALYTIASDLKPMSSGFAELSFPQGSESAELAALRAQIALFRCTDELTADVQIFDEVYEGMVYADALVFHRPRVSATILAFAEVFVTALGLSADDPPLDVVDAVDRDPTTDRFRGYGHLFGYPAHAVDFFAEAAEHEARTGDFVERDFISIPTFESETGRFVYAVPKGHQPNPEDLDLQARALPVLDRYRSLREEFIGADRPGVLALVRAWFDDGEGRCSPRHALQGR